MADSRKSSIRQQSAAPGEMSDSGVFQPTLARNIQVLLEKRRQEEKQLRFDDRIADAITRFSGSMRFVYLHLALFICWIAWNTLPLPVHKFDPQLIILAMWASVEAIFLSTFILISQNRQMQRADQRADLDLQVNLLAEHELSRLIDLVSRMAEKMGVGADDPELETARGDVRPEQVLQQIENIERQFGESSGAS